MSENRELFAYRAAILQDLDSRIAYHKGQAQVAAALDRPGCKIVFNQCGRKWGKTAFGLRELIEAAILPFNDAEGFYYIAPEDGQAKEIVWETRRIHRLINPAFIKEVSESELRIVLKNDRFIKVDGSNNFKKHEGTQPGMVVLDEFKRFKPQLWDILEPNLSVFNAPVIFMGAPPDNPCQYTEIADFVRKLQETTGEGYFMRQPSWMNDKVPGLLTWLKKRREHLIARGEFRLWQREYEAIYKPGGKSTIFPMFDRDKLARKNFFIRDRLLSRRWDLYCIADPGGGEESGTFGVLFIAYDSRTKEILLLDCVYEKDRSRTSCFEIWKSIESVAKKWHPKLSDWNFHYDDHEIWFGQEIVNYTPAGVGWSPVGKFARSWNAGIGTIKDLLGKEGVLHVNEETLEPLFLELSNYQTNERGKHVGADHLIDPFRYFLTVVLYDPSAAVEQTVPEEWKKDPWLQKMAEGVVEDNQEIEINDDFEMEQMMMGDDYRLF